MTGQMRLSFLLPLFFGGALCLHASPPAHRSRHLIVTVLIHSTIATNCDIGQVSDFFFFLYGCRRQARLLLVAVGILAGNMAQKSCKSSALTLQLHVLASTVKGCSWHVIYRISISLSSGLSFIGFEKPQSEVTELL